MRGRGLAVTAALLAAVALARLGHAAGWTPDAWKDIDTLEFRTVGPEEGEHWSIVWLVVIDGQVYIRLGTRAAERMEKNTTAPKISVKIDGQQFDGVTAVATPDQVKAVADAMGQKYFSDVFVRYFNHPLTMRLDPPTG